MAKIYEQYAPEDIVFGIKWFTRHQKKLLWLLNTPVIRYWFRWVMRIRSYDCPTDTRITQIMPSNFSYGDHLIVKNKEAFITRTTDFRTHDKFAKRLYFAFKPLWYVMHALDWAILDRIETALPLSFGFSTLTVFPDGTSGLTTYSGEIIRQGGAETWSAKVSGVGTLVSQGNAQGSIVWCGATTTTNMWGQINRSIFTFDTSPLTSAASISAAVMSIFGSGKNDNLSATPNIDTYTATPAANNTFATGDYQQIQATSQTGSPITYSGWSISAYNAFTFNATGISNVSKIGISKFGTRTANYDVANTAPPWTFNAFSDLEGNFSDQTGTTQDPKLVITYTSSTAWSQTCTETINDTPTMLRSTTRNLMEVITDTATFLFSIVRILTEAITDTPTFISLKVKASTYSESTTSTDSLLRALVRSLTETITDTATMLKNAFRTLTEAITDTDTLTKLKTSISTLSETITDTDFLAKIPARILSEVTSTADTVIRMGSKILSEVTTSTSSMLRSMTRSLFEIVTDTDTLLKNAARILTEAITDSDTLAKIHGYGRVLTEAVTNSDTFLGIGAHLRTLTESFSSLDILIVKFNGIVTNLWGKIARTLDTWTKQDNSDNGDWKKKDII